MKKRTFSAVLAVLMIFALCACGSDKSGLASELNSAVAARNGDDKKSADYLLEITVGSEGAATLYYVRGSFVCDAIAGAAYTSFSQTWLGSSEKAENYFRDGIVTFVSDGEVETSAADAEKLFASFPYFGVPEYDSSCRDIAKTTNARGEVYTYTRGATKEFCESIIGGDVYSLAYVITQPQPDKTEYGDVTFSVTVLDGTVLSFGCEFDVKLFDTPAYIPNYSVPESEYTLMLHINTKISYNDGDFEIPEYTLPVDSEG